MIHLLRRSGVRVCAVFLAIGLLAGCGTTPASPDQIPVYPVKGQVFVGKNPAAGAFILLVPAREADDSTVPRPRATVNEDGSFALSTYGEQDGAPAGDYLVTITWPVDGRDDEDKLGGRYRDPARSGLKATVKEGPNELPAFKLR